MGSRQNDGLLPKPMLFHQPMVSQSCLLDDPSEYCSVTVQALCIQPIVKLKQGPQEA